MGAGGSRRQRASTGGGNAIAAASARQAYVGANSFARGGYTTQIHAARPHRARRGKREACDPERADMRPPRGRELRSSTHGGRNSGLQTSQWKAVESILGAV